MRKYSKYINLNRPILITGESGIGKSTLARKIFNLSQIYKNNFQTLHIASIKEELIESELFGHLRGAFTGAVENKQGYLQKSQGGTLFIDEIGDLSLEAQKKLLYVLEEKEFISVGDTKVQKFNGRFIFATNKDLREEVKKGKFREDLFYRILVFQIHLENICHDKEKLNRLIQNNLDKAKIEFNKPNLKLSTELEQFLMNYAWPGNIRELKNTIESIVVNADQIADIKHLPNWIELKKGEGFLEQNYWRAVEEFEAKYLRFVLEKNQGKINETSKLIGLSKAALIYKARKYKINTQMIRAVQDVENIEMEVA